ncbi:DUF1080 domain-containing protein [Isosphaeraceae bacterium EP7]
MSPRSLRLVGLGLVASTLAGMAPEDGAAPYGSIAGLTLASPEHGVDTPSTPPPAGAIVLFDGKDLDAWVGRDGKPPGFTLVDGKAAQVKGGDIRTKETFNVPVRLHVEFRTPYMPEAKGQGRGNSGVYLQGRYEVQVLDSYGLKSQDNDCGGIYKVAVPLVNACKAPTVWQAYDIDFTPPRFEAKTKVEPARISVRQNGQVIHKDVKIELDNTVSGMGGDPSTPGPIMLQDHGNPVQYRNIWILKTP